MRERGQVRVGTSGWVYRHWRGVFYPARLRVRDWFAFYTSRFDTVEINNTFYRLPSVTAVSTWKEQALAGFLYAVKGSRFLTYRKKLMDAAGPLDTILGLAQRLGNHEGPLLFQLPPHWRCDVPRLRQFIGLLPRHLTHVFEFRDPSWCNEEVRALLAETGMSYCIHDMPGFACPEWVTARTVYVRLHGPGAERYAGRYDRGRLRDWAARINSYRTAGHDVFVYFNNDGSGHAAINASELREELGDGASLREPAPAQEQLSPT